MSRTTFSRFTTLTLLLTASVAALHAQNREILAEYRIGIVGKDQNNVIYQAAHLGAADAARDLSRKYSIDVELLALTPVLDQGESQAASLARLFIKDADALIISPEHSGGVRPAIEFALEQGQAVVFFENSLEGIDPLAAVIANEYEAGRLAGAAMLNALPTGGRAAILTTNNPTPEIEARLQGVRSALGFRRIETLVHCEPDYRSAVQAIAAAKEADRNDLIKGWVFLGDWPLQGLPALPWTPGRMPAVAITSSPSAFIYVDQRYLNALIVHPYYDWGYQSVEILVNQLYRNTPPENPVITTEPTVIDFRNLESYRQQWRQWQR